jgi:RimJ/RimL family protein N-acetyltransferase
MTRLIPPVVRAGTLADTGQPDVVVDAELVLRPWRMTDAPAVVRAFSSPDIQHWHFRRYDTADEAKAWIEECHDAWQAEKFASWAVTRQATR